MAPLDATPDPDRDPLETQEWLDALKGVIEAEGPARAHYLIERLIDAARKQGAFLPFSANTDYINTLPVDLQPRMPGDSAIEERSATTRAGTPWRWWWRANKHTERRGHIASYARPHAVRRRLQSLLARALGEHGGDLVFIQGHSPPASTRARSCSGG